VPTDRSIKNLIFDLGGVILDLSVDTTVHSFAKLSGVDPDKAREIFVSSSGFEIYEKGGMSDDDFRQFVRDVYKVNVSDEQVDTCWNAMLLGFPTRKLELLENLKTKYNVYLLSNTNSIHLDHINNILLPRVNHHSSLDDFFHRAYYSHRMKKRKPDAEIFEQVLQEGNFRPEETLFLDDNQANVEGASKLGIKIVHVVNPDMIYEYFHE
jgi:glucose-1-phosphatase